MPSTINNKILVLAGVLVVLAVTAYFLGDTEVNLTGQPPPTVSVGTSPAPALKTPSVAALAEAEKVRVLLAADPGPNATAQQQYDYSLEVAKAAKYTSELDVSLCAPVPGVLHVSLGSKTTITNTDSERHELSHFAYSSLSIEGNSKKSFVIDFTKPGIFSYWCDGKVAGIFFVTPQK